MIRIAVNKLYALLKLSSYYLEKYANEIGPEVKGSLEEINREMASWLRQIEAEIGRDIPEYRIDDQLVRNYFKGYMKSKTNYASVLDLDDRLS